MSSPEFPLRGSVRLNRRTFLLGTASFAAAALWSNHARGAALSQPRLPGYPFTLGVASGDPLPDGVVLWTRLAPRPLEPGGGMGTDPVVVEWQIAEDENMQRVLQRGTATATADWAHSVHVEVNGLRADRWYWYQFKVGAEVSPLGRTRTMPPVGSQPERLRFAFASCQKYQSGFYTAYEHMAREDLDLIVHLGDYIYEGERTKADLEARAFPAEELHELDDYRIRYAIYKRDPALQAAHAMAPWIVTWDDHEVSNDYAADHCEHPDKFPPAAFLRRRASGYQAYFEHQPLRRSALPHGPDMLLYRRLNFGRLVDFHVLDTRQYRTIQPQGGGLKPDSPILLDPKGTIMGEQQRTWLHDGLVKSPAAWNSIAQQVLFARVDRIAGPEVGLPMDKWAGYEFERRRLMRHFKDAAVRNPVVLTGDIHNNWANEIPTDPNNPDSASIATEFVGTSISTSGDGGEKTATSDQIVAENPCVKFFNNERGYVRCEVTPKMWRSDYRTVPYVSRPGAPLNTRASFVVESGRPQLQRT
jgi:alkaline phosphatase D